MPPPIIVITSNRMRELPAPFMRRCICLSMDLPTDRDELLQHLTKVGGTHFPDLVESVLIETTECLMKDREETTGDSFRPGQAEYLDMLMTLNELSGEGEQKRQLAKLSRYVFKKSH